MLRNKIIIFLLLTFGLILMLNLNCGDKEDVSPKIYSDKVETAVEVEEPAVKSPEDIKTLPEPVSGTHTPEEVIPLEGPKVEPYDLNVQFFTDSDLNVVGGQNKVDISWSYLTLRNEIMVSWNTYETVDKFEIYRSTTKDDLGSKIDETSYRYYKDANVTKGTKYYYTIVSVKNGKMGPFSEQIEAFLEDDSEIIGYNLCRNRQMGKSWKYARFNPETFPTEGLGVFEDANLPSNETFYYVLEGVTANPDVVFRSNEQWTTTNPPNHQDINASMRVKQAYPTSGALTLDVNVFDQVGDVVPNLNASNFTVQANLPSIGNITASISSILPLNPLLPMSGACTLDYSGSMYQYDIKLMEYSLVTAILLFKKPASEYEIIKFGTNVVVEQSLTSDTNTLVNAIFGPTNAGGSTALYDSIYQGINDVATQGINTEKYVVAFTDGGENASSHTMSNLTAISTSNSIPVYVVAYGTGNLMMQEVQDIAMNTGGAWVNGNGTGLYQTSYTQTQNGYTLVITFNVPIVGTFDINFIVNYNGMSSNWTYTVTVT